MFPSELLVIYSRQQSAKMGLTREVFFGGIENGELDLREEC